MTGYQIEYRVKRDQTIRYVYEQADILLDKNGYLDGLVGYIQDITNTKLSNHVLEKEKQLSQIYNNPDVGIWSINIPDAQYVNCSKGIEYISGYTQDDFNNGIQWSRLFSERFTTILGKPTQTRIREIYFTTITESSIRMVTLNG